MNKTLKILISQKSFIVAIILIGSIASLALYSLSYGNYNPYNPSSTVAGRFAVPAWATIFPQYRGLPPDISEYLTPNTLIKQYNLTSYEITVAPNSEQIINFPIAWEYKVPKCGFEINFNLKPIAECSKQFFMINVTWALPNGTSYDLATLIPSSYSLYYLSTEYCFIQVNKTFNMYYGNLRIICHSVFLCSLPVEQRTVYTVYLPILMFPKEGIYNLSLIILNNSSKPLTLIFTKPHFSVIGEVYGLLGTDDNGAPVFKEFAIGARFDLEIALFASILIVLIGAIFGMISGYYGGKIDLSIVGLTDFFLLIPGLPLLISLETALIKSGLHISKILLIIVLISILSWPGTSRIIRSQTLSIRNRTFIEASRALGLNNIRIIAKHVLPNLIPIIAAQVAYDVPTVVLIEAGLDFLGLGILCYPTWGNMLGFAASTVSSANGFAWWWILPPGIGIIVLSAAFFYLGNAFIKAFSVSE